MRQARDIELIDWDHIAPGCQNAVERAGRSHEMIPAFRIHYFIDHRLGRRHAHPHQVAAAQFIDTIAAPVGVLLIARR